MVTAAGGPVAEGGVPVLADNTFATPAPQNPAAHGAALVLHSGTKYLGGHGDVVACDGAWAAALRRVRAVTGAIVHPLAAYLLHRGLQTLPLRVGAQQATAQRLAAWLASEAPNVARVQYPGLPDGDPLGLVGRQMRGPGAMIAVQVAGGPEAGMRRAMAVVDRVRLITHAVSLGGVDSLIQHPAALTHRPVAADARPGPDVLRLSVGLESYDDLRADLERALTG